MVETFVRGAFALGALVLVLGMASCSKKAPEQKAAETPPPANSNLALVKALGDSIEKVTLGAANGPQVVVVPSLAGREIGRAHV